MQNSSRSASTSSRRSNQSLSDKLSQQMLPTTSDQQQQHPKGRRKRHSLTSDTTHSTAASSSATLSSSADPLAASVHASKTAPAPPPAITPMKSNSARSSFRRTSAASKTEAGDTNNKNGMDGSSKIIKKKKKVLRSASTSASSTTLSNLLVRDEWEQKLHQATAPSSDTRSKASRGSRASSSRALSVKATKSKNSQRSNNETAATEAIATAVCPSTRRSSTNAPKGSSTSMRRGRSSRKLGQQQPMGSQSETQIDSMRRRRSPASPTPKGDSNKGSTRRKSSVNRKKTVLNSAEQQRHQRSLSSFMQKAESQLPTADRHEALEVRSAYTSISRARKSKSKTKTQRQKSSMSSSSVSSSQERRSRSNKNNDTKDDDNTGGRMNTASLPGASVRRTNSLQDLSADNGSNTSPNQSSARRRSNSRKSRRKDGRNSIGSGDSSTNLNGSFATFATAATSLSSSQHEDPFGASMMVASSSPTATFRRTLSENPQDFRLQHFSATISKAQFHQYQPNFMTSLPVLREERKSSRKGKLIKATRKSTATGTAKMASISQRELSAFLEKCNSKRLRQETNHAQKEGCALQFPSSPMSGDRSCVSMPAASGVSQIKKLLPLKVTSKTPPNMRNVKGSNRRRRQSQQSSQTSSSDPYPVVTRDSKRGPLIEKLASTEKKVRRARSRSKTRSRVPQLNDQIKLEGRATRASELKKSQSARFSAKDCGLKSKSVTEERKQPTEERPRSLSRTRQQSQETRDRARKTIEDSNSQLSVGNSGVKQQRRPNGFQKLFSIRDLTSQDAATSESSNTLENDVRLASVETEVEVVEAEERAPRTPSNSNSHNRKHGVSDDALLMTPPPPLVSFSPVSKLKGRIRRNAPSTGIEKTGHSKSPSRKHRFSRTDEMRPTSNADRTSKSHSSHTDISESVLHGDRPRHQASHETTAESEQSVSQTESYQEVKGQQVIQDEEVGDSGVEEDVFSHYTWSINTDNPETEHYLRENQRERVQMKASIRQSLLYRTFEAIDRAL